MMTMIMAAVTITMKIHNLARPTKAKCHQARLANPPMSLLPGKYFVPETMTREN